jgi:hypothetical protein
LEVVKAEANVAATAAGSAPVDAPPGIGAAAGDMDAFAQISGLGDAMEDRFALLQIQVESIGGGCPCIDGRCPCSCNKASAPVREPPKRDAAARASATFDEFTDTEKDPWRACRKKGGGGDGGGEPGGDGGDDGADDDDDHHDRRETFNGDMRGRKLAHQYEYGRLFEAKEAKFLPEFDGETKAGLWRRKVSSYLITKYPDIAELLEWVEKKQTTLDSKSLKAHTKIDYKDTIALGKHLWGFLNVNLHGDAYEVFGNIPRGDGLEVWRRVLEDTCQKTKAEKLDLEHAVMQPRPCTTVEQVPMALERWQTSLQTYLDSGGRN